MNHYCREASRLMSDRYERKLTFIESVKLRTHLLICDICRNFGHNMELLEQILNEVKKRGPATEAHLPDDQRQKIADALKKSAE